MLQAAYRGIIDFSEARPSDRWWWFRLKWLLNELEADNERKIMEMHYALNVSVLDYETEEKIFSHHLERANELLRKMYNSLFGWNKQAVNKKDNQKLYADLIEEWKRRFGDPKDPIVAAQIAKTVKKMRGKK